MVVGELHLYFMSQIYRALQVGNFITLSNDDDTGSLLDDRSRYHYVLVTCVSLNAKISCYKLKFI
jgi:hypothetical protein